jgi:ABC-2 type transport system ATP-binding protein
MDEIAIKVDGVFKDFRLPHQRAATLKSLFTSMLRGKKSKTVERQHALRNISFEIKKGEFFGIVGRNGSGKSTLLKMLAGIYQPTKGDIYVQGKLVPFIELGVGFNPELTGRENVYLNGALLGFSKKQIDDMYDDIVEFAELEKFMDQKLKNYSSGMQVRLAFSMAIRARADILLVDEVLAVGDADFQRKCFEYFKSLKKNKKTVILVSHDMNAIREYCDRAILIENSELIAEGKPDKIATLYAKMFTEENGQIRYKNEKRWGDQKVKFTNIAVSPKKITTDSSIVLTTELIAREKVTNPIFGFMIKNAASQSVLGTNTQIKKIHTGTFNAGDVITINWQVPNVFSDGLYYIDPAAIHDNTVEVHDWWEEAHTFRVYNDENTPYVISPDINFEISTIKKK